MSATQMKRGLPKRCSNIKRQARRAASWARCQLKKDARRKLQKIAEAKNARTLAAAMVRTPTATQRRKILRQAGQDF